jgi:hypothetical protein
MREHTAQLCDELDAAVFTGDEFFLEEARKEFREFMGRWERGLKEHEETEARRVQENRPRNCFECTFGNGSCMHRFGGTACMINCQKK